MKLRMRGNNVAVEKLKKQTKSTQQGFLVMPETTEFFGAIRFIGEGASKDLQIGQKVIFADKHQLTKLEGMEVAVMEDSNILAVLDEEPKAQS